MDEAFRLLDTALEQRATALVMLVGNDSWEAGSARIPPGQSSATASVGPSGSDLPPQIDLGNAWRG